MTDHQNHPPDLHKRWKSCADAIGVDPSTEDESELSLISAEAQTRDLDWLNNGVTPNVIYEKERDSLYPHERGCVDVLQANGFQVKVLEEDEDAAANIDLLLGGEQYEQLWEMKNVGDGKHSIEDQLRRARDKWVKLEESSPVRIVVTSFGRTKSDSSAIEEILSRSNLWDEVLYVSSDGKLIRRLTN